MVARVTRGPGVLYLLVVLAAGILASQAALAQKFITVELPNPPDSIISVNGINEHGVMVGAFSGQLDIIGFLLQNGVFTNIACGTATFASAINDNGDVVGSCAATGPYHGFLLSKGVYTTIDPPNSTETHANGINNAGQIVGTYLDPSGQRHGFLLSAGAYRTIDVPGSTATDVQAINNAGTMVGYYHSGAGDPRGFVLQNGVFTPIDAPQAKQTFAFGINDAGQIVGGYIDPNSMVELGFERQVDGTFTTINFPAAVGGFAVSDINDTGQLVGEYNDAANANHGFVSAIGPFAYVANTNSDSVSMIDIPTSLLVTNISVGTGAGPWGTAISPDGKQLYVTNNRGNSVSVIDTTTSTLATTIPNIPSPLGVAFSPDGSQTYVVNGSNNTVSVIDTTTQTLVNTVQVGSSPVEVAMSLTTAGTFAFVTDSGSDNVSVIAVGPNPSVVKTINVGSGPRGIAGTPNNALVYVENAGSKNISVIDVQPPNNVTNIQINASPFGTAFTPDSSFAYVADSDSDSVSVIDVASSTIVNTVPGFSQPTHVALSTDGARAYVANLGDNTVSMIDTASNEIIGAKIQAGSAPIGVAAGSVAPKDPPLQITVPLSPTDQNVFDFVAHEQDVKYPAGTNFSNVFMTTTAFEITPVEFQQRVANTSFAGATCIVYSGAGGNCVDYRVTCSDAPPPNGNPIVCPNATQQQAPIDVQTSFTTSQPIINPGYLTTPTGQNQWTNIFSDLVDPTVVGKTRGFGADRFGVELIAVSLGTTNSQGPARFELLSPELPREYGSGQVIPMLIRLTSVANGQAITGAQASISVVGITIDGQGNPKRNVVLSKGNAFKPGVNPGEYKYKLDASNYTVGIYNVTIYGELFRAYEGQFTMVPGAGQPILVPKPTSLDFGKQDVGTASGTLRVALFNQGTAQGIVSGVQITAGDFQIQTNQCMNGVKPGTHCDVYVTFSPTALGTRTATLSFIDNAPGSPQTVSLLGAGATTTTTSLASSLNPSRYGQEITLSAVVVPAIPSTPTGNVIFYDDVTPLGSGALTNGTAALRVSTLIGGPHSLTAVYAGGEFWDPSTSAPVPQTVARASVKVALASNANPSYVNQPVTYSVVVSGSPATPTGTVIFKKGTKALGTATLLNRQASFTTAFTKAGSFSIFADYSGDENYLPRNSKGLKQTVQQYSTSTTLTSKPNPSKKGQSVALTATVSSAAPGGATGTVTFNNGTTSLGKVNLSGGIATLNTTDLPVGTLTITADYSGDMQSAKSSGTTTQTVD